MAEKLASEKLDFNQIVCNVAADFYEIHNVGWFHIMFLKGNGEVPQDELHGATPLQAIVHVSRVLGNIGAEKEDFLKVNPSQKPSTIAFLFNGPPGSGKDHGALLVQKMLGGTESCAGKAFKEPLLEVTQDLYKVTPEWWDAHYYDQQIKNVPQPELYGKSPRQALIHVSERVMKPNFGQDIFGKLFGMSIPANVPFVTSSDSGFVAEVEALIPFVKHAVVFRLTRPNTSFAGDSRSYLPDELAPEYNSKYTVMDINNRVDEGYNLKLIHGVSNSLNLISLSTKDQELQDFVVKFVDKTLQVLGSLPLA